MPNPFHPTFGVSPPLLVGRDHMLDEFTEALEDGPGSAGRATLYTGARVLGKTVMLNAVEDRAKVLGWVVISETAFPGFVARIGRQHLPGLLSSFDPDALRRRPERSHCAVECRRVDLEHDRDPRSRSRTAEPDRAPY